MTLDETVKAMIISEYPLDSVIGSSKQCKEAMEGIYKCIESEKPDVIFVDGLFSRIRYRETDIAEVVNDNPLENFMETRFDIGTKFLNELKKRNPSSEVYYVLSDADEHNIRRLTQNAAMKVIQEKKEELSTLKKERAYINKSVKKYKELGKDKEASQYTKKKTELNKKITKLEKTALLRIPSAESAEWRNFKESTQQSYIDKIKQKSPSVNISASNVKTKVKGYVVWYSHSWSAKSDIPSESRTNRFIEQVRKDYMGDPESMPDFFLESGHHGEAIAHPFRHNLEDKYSLVASGAVMEDQNIVKKIRDKEFKPELFHGKINKIEACKRQSSSAKIPPPGISVLGKNKDGYYVFIYSISALSEIGKGSAPMKLDFQDANLLSDIHVGKGAVRYDTLEKAIKKLENELETRVKDGKDAPILLIPNESLQGYNYKSMPVETSKQTPMELEKILLEAYQKGASPKEMAKLAGSEMSKNNYPRISDQVRWYFQILNNLVLNTLIHGKYEPSVVFNEGTHVAHTTGDFGISEVFLQTFPYYVLEMSAPILKKIGLDDTKITELSKKYIAGGFKKFDVKIGDNLYKFSTVHKPGSAGPGTNIPLQQIKRSITMADDADVFTSAHLHTPYFYVVGKYHTNSVSAFYKGATFNEYDSYGKAGGWSPAVIGYEKAFLAKNKGKKGVYGVQFILSDVL
ncbi:hypothetical protein FJZ53_02895 [Candidatus Woesearchaeota archaeon]|nr:hypothetical protein [Candidatus Woesearchaeota archaeon]